MAGGAVQRPVQFLRRCHSVLAFLLGLKVLGKQFTRECVLQSGTLDKTEISAAARHAPPPALI